MPICAFCNHVCTVPGLTLFLYCWLLIIFHGLEGASPEWRKLHSPLTWYSMWGCALLCWSDLSLHWVLVVKCTLLFLDYLNPMNSINGQKINQCGSLGIQEGSNVTDGGGWFWPSSLEMWCNVIVSCRAVCCWHLCIHLDNLRWSQLTTMPAAELFPWQKFNCSVLTVKLLLWLWGLVIA